MLVDNLEHFQIQTFEIEFDESLYDKQPLPLPFKKYEHSIYFWN